jgi:hypothetical protein
MVRKPRKIGPKLAAAWRKFNLRANQFSLIEPQFAIVAEVASPHSIRIEGFRR